MIEFDPGSFKDPAGRVFYHEGNVFRSLSLQGLQCFEELSKTKLFHDLVQNGLIIPSELVPASHIPLDQDGAVASVMRQERVSVISYPFEWSFDMLRDAALVTLEIMDRSLRHGYILKDATPFNIVFHRNKPVLIDIPSIERRREGEPWHGYAQFCRGFLFPLLINTYRKIDFQPLIRAHLGEIPLSTASRIFGIRDVFKPGILKDVLLQAKLDRGFSSNPLAVKKSIASSLFSTEAILANVRRLRKIIKGLSYSQGLTEWGNYTLFHNYSERDEAVKRRFLKETISRPNGSDRVRVALDLGSNTGVYSEIAYQNCDAIISLDIDPEAINKLYMATRNKADDRTLLITDLSNPSPGMGWGLRERKPVFERIHADFFLALALIHHLRISANIPLDAILDLFTEMAPEGVVEWVDKKDEMVKRMLMLREDVFEDYTWKNFETLLRTRFEVVEIVETHDGNRKLCHVKRARKA